MNNLLENNLEINNNLENLEIAEKQQNFLETNLGQAINSGINLGLRVVLPDFIEDGIIEIKDSLFKGGIKEAFQTTIDNSLNLGKSALGIFTGKFDNISQIKTAVQKGGLIDGASKVLDKAIDWATNEKHISKNLSKTLKNGKKEIVKSIEKGVDNSLDKQADAVNKLNGYIEKWQKYYNEQNFNNMEYQYKKIQDNLEKVIPLENVINKAREVENLHTLIKNKGKNFQLSEEEMELIKLLK